MDIEHQLEALLDRWHEAQDRGETVAPEELCRDCAPLLPELEHRIKILHRFNGLRTDGESSTADKLPALTTIAEPSPSTGIRPTAGQPSALPTVGQEFGDYRIVAVLGQGGMGCVYRAFEAELRRDVALKVMLPEIAAKPQARQRFLCEARAMAAVQNDYVVPVYAVGEVNGAPFLAMPLLAGESLAVRLKRDTVVPADEVRRIGREAAEGLAAAHAKGLIHRDVKPDNIWLEAGTKRVKLLDFGLARDSDAADRLTQERALLGTPAFMSPEQANGEPLDARTDLFSLGSVLYECATGRRAFDEKQLLATLLAVTRHQPLPANEVNPDVPGYLSTLIGHLMEKKVIDRPTSAQAVVERLRALETGEETGADGARFTGQRHRGSNSVQGIVKRPRAPETGRNTGAYVAPSTGLRRLWLVLAAVIVVTLLGTGSYLLRRIPPTTPRVARDNTQPLAAPLTVKVDVRVWKKTDTKIGLDLGTLGALPLQTGDWMRIEAETNRAAYLYILYVDAKGEVSPMFPWRKYNWNDLPPEAKRKQLNLPEDPTKDASPLDPGPSGIEAVLVLARDEPLSAAEVVRLRRIFEKDPELVLLPVSGARSVGFTGALTGQGPVLAASSLIAEQTDPNGFDALRGAVWLGAEDCFGDVQDKLRAPPNQERSVAVLDPVERLRRLVRGELKELGGEVRGVCYPFQGK